MDRTLVAEIDRQLGEMRTAYDAYVSALAELEGYEKSHPEIALKELPARELLQNAVRNASALLTSRVAGATESLRYLCGLK